MKQQDRQQRSKQQIFTAAWEEFGTNEYNAVSMESICTKHKISKGMMYHYYTGKDDLFLLCVQEMFARLKLTLEAHFASFSNGTVSQMMQNYFLCRANFFQSNPKEKNIYENTIIHPPKHLKQTIQHLRQPVKEINQKFLNQLILHLTLRDSIGAEEAYRYLENFEYLFWPLWENCHDQNGDTEADLFAFEKSFARLLDMVLFGIAKQEPVCSPSRVDN